MRLRPIEWDEELAVQVYELEAAIVNFSSCTGFLIHVSTVSRCFFTRSVAKQRSLSLGILSEVSLINEKDLIDG